ncbi:polysaccharide biosynthesis protein [Carboxylicivirga linearis]|uniref:Polysaccharide biosynthesis protein n=1 Tax=Carboxylicivirga linearis TaxID=1628157 RepID=A0ABS5K0D9_9BACT|nr:nucleoside-diphosphate sugar epimerase/dehydratase [Carboxylicivirga linearis]MBS2100596.1 polysaccharide biosynthesis protein [Carboxylicivirga linearis]
MKLVLLRFLKGRIVSPWLILAIDLALVINAFVLAYAVRLNVSLVNYPASNLIQNIIWVGGIYLMVFLLFGSFKGVIRHSNYNEFKQVLITTFIAFLFLITFSFVVRLTGINWVDISSLVLVFHFVTTVVLMVGFRIMVKEAYAYLTKKRTYTNVYIYGAGDMGQITLEAIKNDKDNEFNVVGLIDDTASRLGVKLHSYPVLSWDKAVETGDSRQVKVVILAIKNISVQRKHKITEACIERGWKLKIMPSVDSWVNGISNDKQIRDIRIEDILGRDEIQLNLGRIMEGLDGKVILVTGAAGSIGSEIVRQLLRFSVQKIIMLDIAESALYDLQQELLLSHSDAPFEVVLADITNKKRIADVFDRYKPQIVFNAAAYKHVPLMETYPYEAIRVNIGGTKNLADLAIQYNAEKFVMISTDKAVNPTNVMGTSKRICEIYIQSLSQLNNLNTAFVTTRFGNVLGSNGSVVPLFKKQIEQGGPITVTHKDITRYFMTIPEACQLVLEAGFMGVGGEIFVFDMGEPVKIVNLAKEMIRLSGLKVDEDIKIVYTGLRPGEKLYEELLASKENTLPTHHEKIMIGKVRQHEFRLIEQKIKDLLFALQIENDTLLVSRMKDLVPEYISQNSQFAELDHHIEHTVS